MRILHVDTGREWRGGQTQLLHLLAAHPDRAEVVLPPDAPIRPEVERLGIKVHPVPFWGSVWGMHALGAVIDAVAPDLVAAHTSHAHGHAWLSRRRPFVVHRRVDFMPALGPFGRWKYHAPRGYIAVSRAIADIIASTGVAQDRIAVVPDGVDARPFTGATPDGLREEIGVPAEAKLITAVGALVPHKSHATLVDAMARIESTRPDVWCVIAGEGAERRNLEAVIRAKGLARVRLLGQFTEIPRLLAATDVFCHPSREEGMGQAIVEAMLAGVPVIGTFAGGIPEVLAPDLGTLVVPRDPAELAEAITTVLDDPAVRARAVRARELARERYSEQRMVEATFEAYARFRRDSRSSPRRGGP